MGNNLGKYPVLERSHLQHVRMVYDQEAALMAHNVITVRIFIRKIPTNSVLINVLLLEPVTLLVLGGLGKINPLSKASPREVNQSRSLLRRLHS